MRKLFRTSQSHTAVRERERERESISLQTKKGGSLFITSSLDGAKKEEVESIME